MKRKGKIGIAIIFLVCFGNTPHIFAQQPDSGHGPALENWLAPVAPFWNWSPETFERETRAAGFRWMEGNVAARAAPPRGTFFGKPAYEAVVRFQNGTPNHFTVSYFNRGDSDRALNEPDFQQLVRELSSTLSQRLGTHPMPLNHTSNRAGVRDGGQVWQLGTHRFELTFSHTPPRREGGRNVPFRAEYVQLIVSTFRPGDIPAHANTRVNVYEVRANVQRDPQTGDVWIANVPMVDQGPKGYCAAATAERVMRYFGQDVDQHQIAQIANTTSGGGTSFDDFKTALQAIARQYNYSFNTHIDWSFRDFQQKLDHYNRVARSKGEPLVEIRRGQPVNITMLYGSMRPDTLVESRQRRRADFNRFEERVRRYVDGGCPLIWGVMLGVVPERGIPQTAGGHLRLIIGYNTQTREILFSDSWGRGHELKRMGIEEAFAITTALYSLEPRGLRL